MSSSAVDLSDSDSSGSDEQQNQSHSESQHQPSANGNFQPGIVMPSTVHIVPHSQLEAGHIMAPVAYPYIDPYYGGIIAAYSGPSMMHPHLMGIVQAGVPLPTDAVEEPVYVNAKQYHGILRRRQSRAKAESVNKLIKSRKGILMEILFCPAVCSVFLASSQQRHHGGPHKFDSLASNLYMRHLEGCKKSTSTERIFDVAKWLAFQGCAFRGHDESQVLNNQAIYPRVPALACYKKSQRKRRPVSQFQAKRRARGRGILSGKCAAL